MRHSVTLSYALLALLTIGSNFVIIPVHASLLVTSFLTIYIGCHRSLLNVEAEKINSEDAAMFPIVGSGVLFSLYMAFKLLPKYYVNLMLQAYFMILGTFAVSATLAPVVRVVLQRPARGEEKVYKYEFNVPAFIQATPVVIEFDTTDAISLAVSSCISAWYVATKHWCGNNFFGICFSIQGMENISLGSYKVGAILLVGLFFYDIFWVFGTDVMVTVAKSFDAPIKLLFPRAFATADTAAQFSMLGLGDIVMPGIFIALLLRYDLHRAFAHKPIKDSKARGAVLFPKPFFNSCILAYVVGLITTVLVMYKFGAAQPALLYLVPACLGSSLLTAIARGEVGELFAYSEEDEPADAKKGEKGTKMTAASETAKSK